MREVRCVFRNSAYVPRRLSVRSPHRSAVPLASAGIICLGLVPTLGGPDRPLHWIMTAGMTGFGLLLAVRHRLGRDQVTLGPVSQLTARRAGNAVLWVSAVIAAFVLVFVFRQLAAGGPIGAFSLAMPVVGLVWLVSLGLKARRLPADHGDHAGKDRPSRRPPSWERRTPTPPGSSPPSGGPGRHASA